MVAAQNEMGASRAPPACRREFEGSRMCWDRPSDFVRAADTAAAARRRMPRALVVIANAGTLSRVCCAGGRSKGRGRGMRTLPHAVARAILPVLGSLGLLLAAPLAAPAADAVVLTIK